MRFSLTSNAATVVAAFARNAAVTQAKVSGIVAHYGQLLVTKVKANASGRPGPRVQTGDYRRSINMVFKGGLNPEAAVGTNRPQGRRLEFGFHGTDSAGRTYNQGPLPHFRPALKAIERPFLDAIARIAEGEVHGP